MAETVGDDWAAGACAEHARFRERALRSGSRPRPVGAQHRARTSERRRLGRRRRLEDDDGRVLRRARRSGRRATRSTSSGPSREQLESEFFLAWYRFMVGYFADASRRLRRRAGGFARSLRRLPAGRRPFDGRLCRGVRPAHASSKPAISLVPPRVWMRSSPAPTRKAAGSRSARRSQFRADIALATGDAVAARELRRAGHRDDSRRRRARCGRRSCFGCSARRGGWRAISTPRRPRSTRPPPSSASYDNDWLRRASIEYEGALVARRRGEPARAEDLLHSALERQARHDLKPGIAATLDALGALALGCREPE